MIKAKGDSMLPRIAEGDYVIARKTSVAESGRIYVCVQRRRMPNKNRSPLWWTIVP